MSAVTGSHGSYRRSVGWPTEEIDDVHTGGDAMATGLKAVGHTEVASAIDN